MADRRLLTPDQVADQFGLSLGIQPGSTDASANPASTATSTDLLGISATWGKVIPYLFGTVQIIGQPLWTGDAQYIQGTDGTTNLVVDFAVVFGRPGPNSTGASLRNLYMDGALVISVDPDTGQVTATEDFSYVFYQGNQTAADATIAAKEDPYTPGFLGLIYIVFNQYVTVGTKFPQVIAEMHLEEIVEPSGAYIYPFDYNNTKVASQTYQYVSWDYDAALLYCWRFVTGDLTCDLYDTNGQQYLYSITLPGSGGDISYVAGSSPIDQSIYWIYGYFTIKLSDTNGDLITSIITTIGGIDGDIQIGKGTTEADETLIVPSFSKKIELINRVGSSLVSTNTFDFNDLATGLPGGSNEMRAFCGIVDYSTIPFDTNKFTITYCCGPTFIGRIIKSAGDANVAVGISYSKETSSAYTSHVYRKTTEIAILHTYTDNSSPFQLWVADNGRRVYVLLYNNTTSQFEIQAYDTFYELFNTTTQPRAATLTQAEIDAQGGFEYFAHVYTRKIVPPDAAGYNKGNQIRKPGQYIVGVPSGSGHTITLIDLRSGTSSNHVYGDWKLLPKLGTFDYGTQSFDPSVIYDPDNRAVFYYHMGTYKDFPGRAYLANPNDGTRPNYSLANALLDLSVLAGYDSSKIVIDGIDEYIVGMALNQGVSYTDLISQICAAFRVDLIETTDFGLHFRKRAAMTIDFTIVPADCVPQSSNNGEGGSLVAIDVNNANQLPNILQLEFVDPENQYLVGIQQAKRAVYPNITVTGKTVTTISIPIVMTQVQAQLQAGYALFAMWAGAVQFTVVVGPKYSFAEVGDICTLTLISGRVTTCKVAGMQYNADMSITFTLSAILTNQFIPKTQIPVT